MRWLLVNCALRTTPTGEGARVPLASLCLLAAAAEGGYDVAFRDYQLMGEGDALSAAHFAESIDDPDADVIAISCMSNLLPLVIAGTAILKARRPDVIVVLGGIGPSGVAAPLMEAFPHVDVVAPGEGEATFCQLLAASTRHELSSAHGILFRTASLGGDVVRTESTAGRLVLDELPMPAYDRVAMTRYRTVGIQTARGCPFPCRFCDVSAYWGRKTTYRSVARVMEELHFIQNHGFSHIEILDDTFILDRVRTEAFCREWTREKLKIRWSAYCRIDLLDEGLIDIMAASGCHRVFLGLESGSDTVLRRISKPFNRGQLLSAVARMVPLYAVACNLMWGFPFETIDDLRQTVELMEVLSAAGCIVTLSLVSPLPLSRLYADHANDLVFRQDVQSSFISTRFFDRSARLVDRRPEDFVELIARHPLVFPGFYTFGHDSFDSKLGFLAQRGLGAEKLSRQ